MVPGRQAGTRQAGRYQWLLVYFLPRASLFFQPHRIRVVTVNKAQDSDTINLIGNNWYCCDSEVCKRFCSR